MTGPEPTRRRSTARLAAAAALILGLVAIVLIATGGGSPYTARIEFQDAGQLVAGDLVEVGGIPVGTVSRLSLAPNSVAVVTVALDHGRFTPLHSGTKASIGTVGLSGVTNRFVALAPGPTSAPAIPSGGAIPETDTTPIVDIDELLDTVTPRVRMHVRQWIQESAGILHGNVAGARTTLRYAAAAIERSGAFAGQLTEDRAAFSGLLASGARTAAALATQQDHLAHGITATGSALQAVAAARAQLSDLLTRAPGVLDQGTALLNRLTPTLLALRPVLRDAAPVAPPLAAVLRAYVPVAGATEQLLPKLDASLPVIAQLMVRLTSLRSVAVPALAETTTALTRSLPVFTGLRPYGEDILLGILHGYGGGSAENYDANGQFSRIALGLPGPTLLTSILGFDVNQLSPHFLTGQTAKCPGSAAEPAPDRSNVNPTPGCEPKETP